MRHYAPVVMVSHMLLGSTGAVPSWAEDGSGPQRIIQSAGRGAAVERRALTSALRLLPRLPGRVAVLDATEASPESRPTLLRLDAFVISGNPVIYVVRQSPLLRAAASAGPSSFYVHALAAVLWHEMAHLEGADEAEARRREQELWRTFVRDQRVDGVAGLAYLSALEKRPDHD
jgi:hypothetical protein